MCDVLMLKPYSYLSYKLEREELRELVARAWLKYEINNITTVEEQKTCSSYGSTRLPRAIYLQI